MVDYNLALKVGLYWNMSVINNIEFAIPFVPSALRSHDRIMIFAILGLMIHVFRRRSFAPPGSSSLA